MDRKNAVILAAAGAATVAALAFVATTGGSQQPPPSPCPALPPSSFLCTCLKSSGVTPNLPAAQTSNGSVVISYVQSIGGTCAQDGYYLYLSGEDAAGIGTTCGYWRVNAGGTGSLTLLVSPTTVAQGGTLNYVGTGFTPNGRVDLNMIIAAGTPDAYFGVWLTQADPAGGVAGSLPVPAPPPPGVAGPNPTGPGELRAGDEGSGHVAAASFTVV